MSRYGDYTMALIPKQEFERFPDLAKHIERMAMSGDVGSLSEWDDFLAALNEAMMEARK